MSQRNRNKTMSKKKRKNKNQFDKMRKDNKMLSQKKAKMVLASTLTEDNKKKESKINVPTHELLASTHSYLMLTPW
jgi:adenylate kinase